MGRSYNDRYHETNQKSTDEIYNLIESRKGTNDETGVAERIYKERTGREWQDDKDSNDAMEKAFE